MNLPQAQHRLNHRRQHQHLGGGGSGGGGGGGGGGVFDDDDDEDEDETVEDEVQHGLTLAEEEAMDVEFEDGPVNNDHHDLDYYFTFSSVPRPLYFDPCSILTHTYIFV